MSNKKSREDEWPKLAEIERKAQLPDREDWPDEGNAELLSRAIQLAYTMGYRDGYSDGGNAHGSN